LKNDFVVDYKEGVLVTIYVKPMSRGEGLKVNEELIYSTPEKPVKNKVNKALIKYLSKRLEIPSTKIHIIRGEKSREKKIYIEGVKPSTLIMILKNLT